MSSDGLSRRQFATLAGGALALPAAPAYPADGGGGQQNPPARFPADFRWGTATSAYQIEGAVNENGRGPAIWDRFAHTPGTIIDHSNADVACDHYRLYRDDVQLMKALGATTY